MLRNSSSNDLISSPLTLSLLLRRIVAFPKKRSIRILCDYDGISDKYFSHFSSFYLVPEFRLVAAPSFRGVINDSTIVDFLPCVFQCYPHGVGKRNRTHPQSDGYYKLSTKFRHIFGILPRPGGGRFQPSLLSE